MNKTLFTLLLVTFSQIACGAPLTIKNNTPFLLTVKCKIHHKEKKETSTKTIFIDTDEKRNITIPDSVICISFSATILDNLDIGRFENASELLTLQNIAIVYSQHRRLEIRK